MSESQKGTSRYGKPVRKSKKVRKSIRVGKSRKGKVAKIRCGTCGKFFKSLSEINLHYSANPRTHKRAKPQPRTSKLILPEFHTFSKEKQQRAIHLANILDNPREWQRQMKILIKKKLGVDIDIRKRW